MVGFLAGVLKTLVNALYLAGDGLEIRQGAFRLASSGLRFPAGDRPLDPTMSQGKRDSRSLDAGRLF
jgi:hypothetical protein